MIATGFNSGISQNTSFKVVLPYYIYGALSILTATVLLLTSSSSFFNHYFDPHLLSITHVMALGWGTMMILGASHQLVPVLIEGKLFSEGLAILTFIFMAIGIPILAYEWYHFHFSNLAISGAVLINIGILLFFVNLVASMMNSKKENVHAIFVITATMWLLGTIFIGLLLIINFRIPLFKESSVYYLSLHAHIGIIGWFLLLVIGVASRLIPLFLISKYHNGRILWLIFGLINTGLAGFIILFLFFNNRVYYVFPIIFVLIAVLLFARFCYHAYKDRLRKKVDHPLQLSLLSILMTFIPIVFISLILLWLWLSENTVPMITIYGFCIFFGWITAILFGMTFKTLPFILWNKTYHAKAGLGSTPNPRELFSKRIFSFMVTCYLVGFIGFIAGISFKSELIIKLSAVILIIAACLYNGNVFKMIFHKPVKL